MRLDYAALAPDAMKRIYALQNYVDAHTGLDHKLLRLIQLRASQINGCAFCMHLHTLELQDLGETPIRIDCVSAWHETNLYTEKEQAALAWTEALTLLSETHVPDKVFEEAKRNFTEKEIADLAVAISLINVWNRLAVGFRQDPAMAPILLERVAEQKKAAAMV
ncbi:MAG TPA: carboxymuconolactone decarboxylase family protein [Fimbriimonadaceae bacterium]|nr:carboxymuconolactone decarboxylase family protein [Fimbriimonadaceae bacterium]